jgi:hypothetical protein
VVPPRRGAPIIDHHDHIFLGKGRCVASAWVFLEFPTLSEGPQGHEIFIMSQSLSLCLMGYTSFG